jgi:hypothetical protein
VLLPGPDPISIPATIGLGLAGNFLAGLIYLVLWGHGAPGADRVGLRLDAHSLADPPLARGRLLPSARLRAESAENPMD